MRQVIIGGPNRAPRATSARSAATTWRGRTVFARAFGTQPGWHGLHSAGTEQRARVGPRRPERHALARMPSSVLASRASERRGGVLEPRCSLRVVDPSRSDVGRGRARCGDLSSAAGITVTERRRRCLRRSSPSRCNWSRWPAGAVVEAECVQPTAIRVAATTTMTTVTTAVAAIIACPVNIGSRRFSTLLTVPRAMRRPAM